MSYETLRKKFWEQGYVLLEDFFGNDELVDVMMSLEHYEQRIPDKASTQYGNRPAAFETFETKVASFSEEAFQDQAFQKFECMKKGGVCISRSTASFCKASGVPAIEIAGEFTVKAGWETGSRNIHSYVFIYFPNGTDTIYKTCSQTHRLQEPCVVLTHPCHVHSFLFDPAQPVRHVFIHFQLEKDQDTDVPYVITNAIPLIAVNEASNVSHFLRHILQLAYKEGNLWRERCNSLLLAVLGELDDIVLASNNDNNDLHHPNLPAQIIKSLEFIDNQLQVQMTIEQIANKAGWTHEHYTRIFVKHMGMTPQQYIVERRIERACRLLVQEKLTVKQIAFEVGFESEHYFCRCFKKRKGITATASL